MVEAQWASRHRNLNHFVTCQDEYNLFRRGLEKDLQTIMQNYGLGLIPKHKQILVDSDAYLLELARYVVFAKLGLPSPESAL